MSLSLVLIAASFVSYKSYNPEFQDPSYQTFYTAIFTRTQPIRKNMVANEKIFYRKIA
jgi:hypothetical protein